MEMRVVDPVQAPFINVAVHIVEAPGVGKVRARNGVTTVVVLGGFVVVIVAGIAAKLGQVGIPVAGLNVSPVVQTRSRSRTAGHLPLRFRGKPET